MKTDGLRGQDLTDLYLFPHNFRQHPFKTFRVKFRIENKFEKRIISDLHTSLTGVEIQKFLPQAGRQVKKLPIGLRILLQAGKQLSYRRPPCLLLLRFFQLSPFFPEFCRFFHQRAALPFQNRIIIKQNSNPSFVPGQTGPTDEEKKLPDMVFPV